MSYNPLKTNLNLSSSAVYQNKTSKPNKNFQVQKPQNSKINNYQKNPSIMNLNQIGNNTPHTNSNTKRGSKLSFEFKKSDNIFERYKQLVNEIKRKDKKIIEVQKLIEDVKLSDDPEEIRRLNKMVKEKKKINENLQHKNFELKEHKKYKKKELENLENELIQKLGLLDEKKNYAKSKPELERELNSLQEEYKVNRTALGRKDLKEKMEIEAQCRDTIENKLLLIVLETAKNKLDPEIQSLYQKLVNKK